MSTLTDTFAPPTARAQPDLFLRRVLVADAATCVATGILLLAGNVLLEQWLGLPAALLAAAGLGLLPCAAFIALRL